MKYRAEIDGLRAVAVIPVILFHAGLEGVSGGFVGVDVFFVISGYLITSIILSEKEQGTFSLADFYERRARRILPALFLVMFASLPFAWLWLFPSDMKDFSQSLVAVSVFASNFLFWHETGYWGVENELKPLLHTWSLAVEEQYYLLFPLFIMLMWRFRKRWILGSLLVIAAISFMVAQWAAQNYPTANFFFLLTRAWELAVGASIAFYFLYKKGAINAVRSHVLVDEIAGILGLGLIFYAVLVYNEATPFPGFYALAPTIGAGLVILFTSKETIVGRLLSSRVLVGVGLISYSAYLWHQPLFAFARHRALKSPDVFVFIALISLTFLLAYLTWRYVETPFRNRRKIGRRTVVTFGLGGSLLFISVGLAGHVTSGFEGFLMRDQLTQNAVYKKLAINEGVKKASQAPEIVIWGDSYAMHLTQGILSSNPSAKVIQLTKSVCGPFFDIAPVSARYPVNWAESCLEFTGEVRDYIEDNGAVKYVVVSSLFYQYLYPSKLELLVRGGGVIKSDFEVVATHFRKTLSELEALGVIPIVFSPPPANGEDLGRCLVKAEWNRLSLDECDFRVTEFSQRRLKAYKLLDGLEDRFRVVRLDKFICVDEICKTHFDGVSIFRDAGHFSLEGSAEVGRKFNFYRLITGRQG